MLLDSYMIFVDVYIWIP